MSVSKRFKKKMKDFRQGMTAWRVYGWPISDHNYRDWGKDQEELDRKHGKGNATCFNDGSGWYFIYCEKHCKVPEKIFGTTVWYGGNRKTHMFKSFTSMHGGRGNRVFKKQTQAQAYMVEIMKGSYNSELSESRYFHGELDRLDDMLDDFRSGPDDDYDDHGIYGVPTEDEFA